MKPFFASFFLIFSFLAFSQVEDSEINQLREEVSVLRYTELVNSMTQRSLLIPGYFAEKKGLVARQAYNFWKRNQNEQLVSHLNVYKALHEAYKYLSIDSVNRKFYHEIIGHTEAVVSLKFGVEPNVFYSAGSDGKVLQWNTEQLAAPPLTLFESNQLIKSIDISPDGSFLMVVTKDKGIAFISLNDNLSSEVRSKVVDNEVVQAAAFLPEKSQYVLINKQGEVKIKGYEITERKIDETTEKVFSLIVHPTNDFIYGGTESGSLISWDKVNTTQRYFEGRFSVNSLAISKDLKTLAIGREKGDVWLWDIPNDTLSRVISGHQSAITDLDFSVDDKLLLTASRDGTARVWETENPRKLPILLDDHNDWVLTATFDSNGEYIYTGSKDSFIRSWPLNPEVIAENICQTLSRQFTLDEWNDYVGDLPFEKTCEKP